MLTVPEILEQIDAVEFISQYCDLTEKNGEWWGLSPFKTEKTPSFSVNRETGWYYDFSSGVGGTLVDFVMRAENVSVYSAVQKLKQYAGIKEDTTGPPQRLAAARVARRFSPHVKRRQPPAHQFLSEDAMRRYEFDEGKLQMWADEGISWESMKKFDVKYDRLDSRIVYPIKDWSGKIISVCGRTCDPNWKAKGIRKYTYLGSLGTLDTIYAYFENKDAIIKQKEIILVEGCKSVLKLDTWGIHNSGALLTSHLSQPQFDKLVKLASYHGVRPVFALDEDVQVEKDELIQKLKRFTTVEYVDAHTGELEAKMSPVDMGEEVWRKLYAERRRLR